MYKCENTHCGKKHSSSRRSLCKQCQDTVTMHQSQPHINNTATTNSNATANLGTTFSAFNGLGALNSSMNSLSIPGSENPMNGYLNNYMNNTMHNSRTNSSLENLSNSAPSAPSGDPNTRNADTDAVQRIVNGNVDRPVTVRDIIELLRPLENKMDVYEEYIYKYYPIN